MTCIISGTPTLQEEVGIHPVAIMVHDGELSDTLEYSVQVINTNDAPEFVSKSDVLVEQNQNYSDSIRASDIDDDPLSYGALEKPLWLSLNETSGHLSGTPLQEDVGVWSLQFTVTDGALYDTLAFTVTVRDVNDPPVFAEKTDVVIDQNQNYVDTLKTNDPDQDTLIYAWLQKPGWLSLDSASGILSGTPAQQDTGTSTVEFTVTDGGASDTITFAITVNDVNDPPIFALKDTAQATQYTLYVDTVSASDLDSDPLVFQAVSSMPPWLILDTLQGIMSGMPQKGDMGTIAIKLTVSDGFLSDTLYYALRIIKLNRLPQISTVITDSVIIIPWKSNYNFSVSASDPDWDSLAFSWFVNGERDTSAHDSFFIFNATEIDSFIISVRVADNDTAAYKSWRVFINAQTYIIALRNALPQQYYLKVTSRMSPVFEFGIPPQAKIALENFETMLANRVQVQLRIYDVLGKPLAILANEKRAPGVYRIVWNPLSEKGIAISNGIYICRFSAGHFANNRKFVLLR